jgi:hypothetical protein
MSISIVALLLGFVAAASAQSHVTSVAESYSNGYTYITYYSQGREYVYTYETCSSPPSSVEVCLTSIFYSVEKDLTLIDVSLKKYEVSIETEMKYEHNLLYDEVSWVKKVNTIASSVKKAVLIEYENEEKQVKELIYEKEQIYEAYKVLIEQLDVLEVEINEVVEEEQIIVKEYYSVYYAKWSIYKYISELVYEKEIIVKEEVEIEKVVAVLYEQIEKIDIKIEELYKRESWLVSWEEKLSVDMSGFEKDIARFREVEVNLKKEEVLLYEEQERLLVEVEYVEKAVEKLKLEYVHIVSYLKELEIYEKELISISESVSYDAHIFISAYTEFTCEDSLLYYEACVSSHAPVVYAPAPVKGPGKGPVALP